jgi:hypothetical protein
MAYANKITTMKRMALITNTGVIRFEGVNIEGKCLLKAVGSHIILLMDYDEIIDYCGQESLMCKVQDNPQTYWEPRKQK